MDLACPFCGLPARGPYRRAGRWRIIMTHAPECMTRRDPAHLWRCNGWLINAALPGYAGDDEVEVVNRVPGSQVG